MNNQDFFPSWGCQLMTPVPTPIMSSSLDTYNSGRPTLCLLLPKFHFHPGNLIKGSQWAELMSLVLFHRNLLHWADCQHGLGGVDIWSHHSLVQILCWPSLHGIQASAVSFCCHSKCILKTLKYIHTDMFSWFMKKVQTQVNGKKKSLQQIILEQLISEWPLIFT